MSCWSDICQDRILEAASCRYPVHFKGAKASGPQAVLLSPYKLETSKTCTGPLLSLNLQFVCQTFTAACRALGSLASIAIVYMSSSEEAWAARLQSSRLSGCVCPCSAACVWLQTVAYGRLGNACAPSLIVMLFWHLKDAIPQAPRILERCIQQASPSPSVLAAIHSLAGLAFICELAQRYAW